MKRAAQSRNVGKRGSAERASGMEDPVRLEGELGLHIAEDLFQITFASNAPAYKKKEVENKSDREYRTHIPFIQKTAHVVIRM